MESVVLRMRYMSINRAVAKRAEGFLRYVQYRDHHPDSPPAEDVEQLLRYVKHRDATSPGGRLFDDKGAAGDVQRQAAVEQIHRAVSASLAAGGPRSSTDDRAYYQIIISPADGRHADLKALTRAAMRQLTRDSGGSLSWIAGEHRNTAHPHTHVVLAAKRELPSGRHRTVLITQDRRQRMHDALRLELSHQMRARGLRQEAAMALGATPAVDHRRRPAAEMMAWSPLADVERSSRLRPSRGAAGQAATIGGRLARHYQREAEREARRRRMTNDADEHQQRPHR